MALNQKVVPVSLGLSLDTKNDKKQLQGGLLSLQNALVKKTGELQKRNGYRKLPNAVLGGSPISSASSLASFQNELVLSSTSNIYSFSPDTELWANKGVSIFVEVDTKQVQSNSYQQTSGDMAISSNTALYVWEDSRGGSRALLSDLRSGTQFLSDASLNSAAERPRAFACGNYLFAFYFDGSSELLARRADAANPSAFSTEFLVAADINTATPYFDVCQLGSKMVLAYLTAGNEIKLIYFLQSGAVGQPINGCPAPITIAIDADQALAVAINDAGISILYANTTDGVGHVAYAPDFSLYKADVSIDGPGDYRNCCLIYNAAVGVELFWEVEGAVPMNNFIGYSVLALPSNTPSAPEVLQRAAGLASKPTITDRATSLMVSYESASGLQNTYFLINTLGEVEGKVLNTLANGVTPLDSNVPGVWASGDYRYVAVAQQSRIVTGDQETFLLSGLSQCAFNHSSNEIEGLPAELGENLHYAGGFVKAYDSQGVVEHNYHLYPEPSGITTNVAAGNVTAGIYLYKVVFEWIDAKGQVHQSATSVPVQHTVVGSHSVSVVIPTLRYTAKKEPIRSAVIVSVYRTENGGTVYYKVSSDSSPVLNDTTVDTVTFVDNISNANLVSRQLLYTTGGVLDNAPCPPCTVLTPAKNRLFAAGLLSSDTVAFSKPFTPGQGVAFSPFLLCQIPSKGGRVTSILEMDDKVVVFKLAAITALTGDGPNNLGGGNPFAVTTIATDVGCVDPDSVVLTPMGIMFKSAKGIWLLDRSLNTSYIGDKVEAYNGYRVTSAVVVPDLNEVRFTTAEGITLVYNYYFNLWSSFSNQVAIAACNWQGNYLFANQAGEAFMETIDDFSDAGSVVVSKLSTQWFSFAGLQGFQRVYRGMILGQYVGSHSLRIRVFYDFNDSRYEEFTFNAANAFGGDVYGSSSPYGSGMFGGEQMSVYQFQFKPSRQKCQSMRIEISDFFPENEPTGGFNLSAVSLLVGVKSGLNKVSKTQNMTSR